MPTPPPRTWIYFFQGDTFTNSSAPPLSAASKINRYRVEALNSIRGEPVAFFNPGAEILRVCANDPLSACSESLADCTQHLHFTSDAQLTRLLAISAKEIPATEQPVTVLIPIRKSDAWWNLGHDARAELMNGSTTLRGHTAIGEDFAPQIFRQLILSRYLDSSRRPYDFLTYFEFPEASRDAFTTLLSRLRDETLNPEWAYVDMEQEIWMRKVE